MPFHVENRIKDMGVAKEFLSIGVRQCPAYITIDQEQYIRPVLDKSARCRPSGAYYCPNQNQYIHSGLAYYQNIQYPLWNCVICRTGHDKQLYMTHRWDFLDYA